MPTVLAQRVRLFRVAPCARPGVQIIFRPLLPLWLVTAPVEPLPARSHVARIVERPQPRASATLMPTVRAHRVQMAQPFHGAPIAQPSAQLVSRPLFHLWLVIPLGPLLRILRVSQTARCPQASPTSTPLVRALRVAQLLHVAPCAHPNVALGSRPLLHL